MLNLQMVFVLSVLVCVAGQQNGGGTAGATLEAAFIISNSLPIILRSAPRVSSDLA
jgi:hypothetical protein